MTSESTLIIRKCGASDWEDLRAIRLEALSDTPEAYSSTYEETVRWSDGQWKNSASTRLYYFADRGGRVVGMVSGGLNDAHPGTRWLYGMYVTPSERGTGTAELLVQSISEWANDNGANEIYLHVGSTVPRARAFYERVGFRLTGENMQMDRDKALTLFTMVQRRD